jgi:multiple sugar transport system substrate-binding protein
MKARVWTLLTCLLTVGLLIVSGCGTTPAPTAAPTTAPVAAPTTAPVEAPTTAPVEAPTTAPAAGGAVKVTVFVGFGTGTDPSQIELHTQLAQEFNSTHPDIQVEFMTVPYEEHVTKFSTMLAGGTPPDLVMPIGVMGVAEFYDEWLDIAPYIKRDSYDTSDYYGPSLLLQTYPDKTVGLPIGIYPSVTFYNQDLFDKAGLEYPPHKFGDPNWTYDKVIEIGQKLTLDNNGNDATSASFDPANIVQYGWDGWDWSPFRVVPGKLGGNPLGMSADQKTAEMNSGAYVEGMQFIADTIWKYYIRPNGEVASAAFADVDPLQSGTVAMWEVFSWMAYNYSTWTDAFNWDVAAVPAGPKGDIVAEANGDAFVIPKGSKNPDQAWEVAKWLMQPENLSRLAMSYGCIPARKSLAGGWLDGMKAEFPNINWQVFIDSIEYMDASPNNESWVPSYQKVWDATENAMSLIVTGENKNVQEVMDNLDSEVQGYLDEYWATKP